MDSIRIKMEFVRKLIIGSVFIQTVWNVVEASAGDRSQFYHNCMKGCRHNNCTDGKFPIISFKLFFGVSENSLIHSTIFRWDRLQREP